MKKFILLASALLLMSSCAIVREQSVSAETTFEGVAYDYSLDEYTFWLKVPYQSFELGMARVPRRNVSVCLRTDGKFKTTVYLPGRYDSFHRRYSGATILVPSESELRYWQGKLNLH